VEEDRVEFSYSYYYVGEKTGALVLSSKGLRQLLLPTSKERIDRWLRKDYPGARPSEARMRTLQRQLEDYFGGKRVRFEVGLDLDECSTFQKHVYEELRKVPSGCTCSYQALAKAVGRARSARAVGTALKNNPIPIIIPCHRVIKSDGSLGGFNSGVEWKKRLLEVEGATQRVYPADGTRRRHRKGSTRRDLPCESED
jgi:methylated-DNA-[protein]-cysteine S-methyltransferase